MDISISAKHRGSTNVLAPVARELLQRGHNIKVYATGNDDEASGFSGLDYEHVHPTNESLSRLVKGYDVVVVGYSGYNTSDGSILRAANAAGIPTIAAAGIPTIAAQDQDGSYKDRLGTNPDDFPTLLAVVSEDCLNTARKELGDEIGEEVASKLAENRKRFSVDGKASKRLADLVEEIGR